MDKEKASGAAIPEEGGRTAIADGSFLMTAACNAGLLVLEDFDGFLFLFSSFVCISGVASED